MNPPNFMQPRRSFLKNIAVAAGSLSLVGISEEIYAADLRDTLQALNSMPLNLATSNENLWKIVQQSFTLSPNLLNLNNGGVSPQPKSVQEAEQRYLQLSNQAPSYYMWRTISKEIEIVRERLAKMGGCSAEEIAINRNTTEAIQTVLLGLDWKAGDEIVCSEQDYSTVKVGWEWLERRFGVKIIKINLDLPFEDEDYYTNIFINAFSSKTKLVNLTHIINWNGQTVPVAAIRKICDEARKRGIFSLVDGAHSFAHIDFNIPELGCDAYASSLHKWLYAPFGNGLLYVRKDKIKNIWSLFPAAKTEDEDIRKFEHLGTRSLGAIASIGAAIDFHNMMGIKLKQERLIYLRNYWIESLKKQERVKIHNSLLPKFSSAVALMEIEGISPQKVEEILFNKFMIHTVNIEVGKIKGSRISPNVYTATADLDRFVSAVEFILKNH
jgi:selenocysteine lyase/cysteine desulfurase